MKKHFVGYLTMGDGGIEYSLQAALALIEGGVDILEIGIPFSDPVADGPVIQQAMQRSLNAGTKVSDLLPFLKKLREHTQIPLVVFSYYNPILSMGENFLKEAKQAGATSLLIVDLPMEENHIEALESIFIVSPTTSEERLKKICERSKNFIYYVCQKGTTGMRTSLPSQVAGDIAHLKTLTSIPVVCGFGISTQEMAQEVISSADGFVVGSYFVEAMGRKVYPEKLKTMAQIIDPRKKI